MRATPSSANRAARTVETELTGTALLECPLLNKGTAFTEQERLDFNLVARLPPHIDTLETQLARAYDAYRRKDTDLERHIYLRNLQDTNETLFYRLLREHLSEMMPIIYTPVVGAACQQFSEIYRRPRGLFISYPERHSMERILACPELADTRVIVVTDGERILGLGDQGIGGMGIPIGKLSLYTACGGIDPATTLPVILDVGTNNEERLADPLYLGWRHERVSGGEYDEFVDLFVQAVKRRWPHVLLQFEDFAQTHASPLLARYRDQLCAFNDDIQGTAAVVLGTLLAATSAAGTRLGDQTVAFLGAGSAGCGIAEQLVAAMIRDGLTEAEARGRFFMVDRAGLLHDGLDGLLPFQRNLAQPLEHVRDWAIGDDAGITLADTVRNAKPSVLIGVSGQPGLFTEEIVREMVAHVERPMILPLSNPTSRSEAVPADLLTWTDGRALVATGSPFEPVAYGGKTFPIAQSNNSYIFPGVGLGVLAVSASRVSDGMLMAASEALGDCSPALDDSSAPLLPPLIDVSRVSKAIALAVARRACEEGLSAEAAGASDDELLQRIDATYWQAEYPAIRPVG
jgi:malate dehydrogenase (oxaloacetate-decarboxylating)